MVNESNLKNKVKHLMLNNRRHSLKHTYTVPSPESFPFQWFWDSCFHAIILSKFDISAAKQELLALTSKQLPNGMIPHMIYWDNPKNYSFGLVSPVINWGKHRTSSIIQPPMLSYAVWSIYLKDKDKKFLAKMLPKISKFHNYIFKYRDPYSHYLAGLVNPDESGEDNSPRFDSVLELKPNQSIDANYHRRLLLVDLYKLHQFKIKKHMANFHWVRDVPFNSILVMSLLRESMIAAELGKLNKSTRARQKSEAVAAAMRKYMLDGAVMNSTMGLNYHHINSKTWAIFAPLFSGILNPNEADEIVSKHLLSKTEFNSLYSVPTVAMNDPAFNPNGYWRGPVWHNVNWFIFIGLMNYGYVKEARRILTDSLKLINKSGFREQYNPKTGEGYGAEHFTWGGLVLDMLEYNVH